MIVSKINLNSSKKKVDYCWIIWIAHLLCMIQLQVENLQLSIRENNLQTLLAREHKSKMNSHKKTQRTKKVAQNNSMLLFRLAHDCEKWNGWISFVFPFFPTGFCIMTWNSSHTGAADDAATDFSGAFISTFFTNTHFPYFVFLFVFE